MLYQFGRSCAYRGNPLWLPVLVIILRGAHKGRPYVWATYKIDTGSSHSPLAYQLTIKLINSQRATNHPSARAERATATRRNP